jgi:uncharacterized protein YcfJ
MRKKGLVGAVVFTCVSALVVAGCATAGGSAGAGAGGGALLGGIIGHQSGHAVEGALIGAAVGALAGYGFHKVKVKREAARQTRSAEQTVQDKSYEADQGLKLDVEDYAVTPGTVAPGDTVKAKLVYATLGTGADGEKVEEVRELRVADSKKELDKTTETRTDGTWESTVDIEIPDTAKAGQYTLAQSVKIGDQAPQEKLSSFTVETKTAGLRREPRVHHLVIAMGN